MSDAQCFIVGQIEALTVTAERLAMCTRQDPFLSKVVLFTQRGWPVSISEELKPFVTKKGELSVETIV